MNERRGGNWPGTFIVADDNQALIFAAANFCVSMLSNAIQQRGRASLALSGGNTPQKLFELLATPEWKDKLDWGRVHVFWGDERYVPPDNAQSNFKMANDALLKHVQIPAENIHRFLTESGSAEQVAEAYEREIRAVLGDRPEFDIVMLGLGTNAHTASLFPHTKSLHEQKRLVVAEYINEIKAERLTFTFPVINDARFIFFLVSGAEKAAVVRDVIEGPYDPEQKPAQLVRPVSGELTWLMDAPAARLLSVRKPT